MQMYVGECLAGVFQGRREERLPEPGVLLPTEPEFPPRDRADFCQSLRRKPPECFAYLGRHAEEQPRAALVPSHGVPGKDQKLLRQGVRDLARPRAGASGRRRVFGASVCDGSPPVTVREAHRQNDKRQLRCALNTQSIELRPKRPMLFDYGQVAPDRSFRPRAERGEAPRVELVDHRDRVASLPSGWQRRPIGGFSGCLSVRHIRLPRERVGPGPALRVLWLIVWFVGRQALERGTASTAPPRDCLESSYGGRPFERLGGRSRASGCSSNRYAPTPTQTIGSFAFRARSQLRRSASVSTMKRFPRRRSR